MKKHQELVQRVKKIISSHINVEDSNLELTSKPSTFSTWDSLANTMIYLEIVKTINVPISFEEYLECGSLGDVVEAILVASER